MRILVASSGTIPGYSGGWSTTLDLLGDKHESMYLISSAKAGLHSIEGVKYLGLGLGHSPGCFSIIPGRLTGLLRRIIAPSAIRWAFRRFDADFIICLDELMGFSALKAGLPYSMRFHRKVDDSIIGVPLEKLLRGALFSTACQGTDVPGVEVLPHNQDISRFQFSAAARPERALLLTCINEAHEPDFFIEGICRSRSMKGDIIGTGPLRKRIEKSCQSTGERVRCLKPIPRLQLGRLSGQYQIGVATLIDRGKVEYQMKVNMYLACGMHTLVKPWTHIVTEAPELVDTFSTPGELADRLDEIESRWQELEPRRLQGREWVEQNCSVEIPRKRFGEILRETFGDRT
ncbi:hypothetical protein DRQ25_15120 [Candidatus Fermentibacteria bacterium]|nr:MAG: hypothetical protein DRQ25_15120 [Candidatus Fermentibacteria bacterium]